MVRNLFQFLPSLRDNHTAQHPALRPEATPDQADQRPEHRGLRLGSAFSAPHSGLRALGALAAATGSMDASPTPAYHAWLKEWGLLDRLPSSWGEAPVLARLPWGPERVQAPPPRRPARANGPWPQEPILHPDFYPPVLNLSREEELNHVKYNVLRYLGQAALYWPQAAVETLRGPRLAAINQEEFEALLQDTFYAQYLRPGLDEPDQRAFAHLLDGPAESFYKMDFSIMRHLTPLEPGLTILPTVVLLRRDAQGRYRALAIQAGERVIEPRHGHAWALARYFVLQNAAFQSITIWHPRLHFPCDAVHAISLSMLPDGHPIKALMLPHTPLTLGLHKAVIHHRRSVLHNNQREVFTPFACTTESIHTGVALGRLGIEGNRSYPAYRWGDDLPGLHTTYGRYRQQWADAFLALCQEALAAIPRGDRLVTAWADEIAAFVPGFPDGRAIWEEDRLAWAVSVWMRTVSVFHTADHHSLHQIPLHWAPLRLRCAAPDPATTGPLDLDAMVTREDALRHAMAHALFFRPTLVFRLSEVKYDLAQGRPQAAAARFWEEVARLDARWASSGFPTSDQIGASIHY